MKNNVKWELNNEIVARHFFKNVSSCPEPALRRPGALCWCWELPCVSGATGVSHGGPNPGGRDVTKGFEEPAVRLWLVWGSARACAKSSSAEGLRPRRD